jgi:hypothetical protein
MSKERRTVSLDESVDEYLGQPGVNASELVNKLVQQYMNGEGSAEEIREFRLQQIMSEYEDAAARARRKLEEYNRLEEKAASDTNEVVEEAVDTLGIDPTVGHDHAAAETWAEKAGMDVESFWAAYTEAYTDE